MSSIEMIPANRELAFGSNDGIDVFRARHTLPALQAPTGGSRVWGSRGLFKLRAVVGFVFGLVAILIGAIALVIYWYVYKARNRRP